MGFCFASSMRSTDAYSFTLLFFRTLIPTRLRRSDFVSMVPNPMGLYRARVAVSDASTLRTSDWDNPNCRAIKDGLMPALNAARTALICPRGNETVATSCRLWSVRDDRFGTDSSNSPLGGDLPRRFASSTHAVISRSSS